MDRKIVITIDKNTNEIKTEAFGYDGVSCHFELDRISNAIKANTIRVEQKDDNVTLPLEVKYGSDNNR